MLFSAFGSLTRLLRRSKASKLDRVYGMSTYSGRLNGPPAPDLKDKNTYDEIGVTKTISNVTQSAVGKEKYVG